MFVNKNLKINIKYVAIMQIAPFSYQENILKTDK
jgi:hypothetical protein